MDPMHLKSTAAPPYASLIQCRPSLSTQDAPFPNGHAGIGQQSNRTRFLLSEASCSVVDFNQFITQNKDNTVTVTSAVQKHGTKASHLVTRALLILRRRQPRGHRRHHWKLPLHTDISSHAGKGRAGDCALGGPGQGKCTLLMVHNIVCRAKCILPAHHKCVPLTSVSRSMKGL